MLHGDNVTLRAIRRDDLPLLWQFNNDLAVELAGGGDPPMPQSLARLTADFEREAAKGGRDEAEFVIEVEEKCVGGCGLFHYAFQYRNLRRVWLWVHARNERAIRAYHACGFVEEGRLRQHVWSNGDYDDAVYMGILREEWQAAQR